MNADISPELKRRCAENMDLFDVPGTVRTFCLEALQVECFMTSQPGNVRQLFAESCSFSSKDSLSTCLDVYSTIVQDTLNNFHQWAQKLKSLNDSCKHLPPLKVTQGKVKQLRAPYYIKAGELSIQEGEVIEILDWSQENNLKVKVGQEREGIIPILSLIIPSSDFDLISLVERLHIIILCSWFECFCIFYRQLFRMLMVLLEALAYVYPPNVETHATGPKTPKDLKVLKKLVARLEVDFLEARGASEAADASTVLVQKLSAAYKHYKVFEKHLKSFKVPNEMDKSRRLCIFDRLSEFQSRVPKDKPIKYYKTKIVIESVETREEIFHYPSADTSSSASDGWSSQQTKVESERLTSSSQEIRSKIVVRSIKDSRSGEDISLKDAIEEGIMDMRRGFYVDLAAGRSIPIAAAMNEGLIKVEKVTETATKPKVEELGMITVKSFIPDKHMEYRAVQTIDPITAEKLTPDEARKRGWLTDQGYKVDTREIPMDEAIDAGWIQVEYPPPDPTQPNPEPTAHEARTYLIRSVVDERRNRTVTFAEAVARGLIDADHGCYVSTASQEKLSLDEALKRGLVKGRRLREDEDPGSLTIDAAHRLVAGNLAKVKAVVGVLTSYSRVSEKGREAAGASTDDAAEAVDVATATEVGGRGDENGGVFE